MKCATKDQLLIAGMGISGRSVAQFLHSSGIPFQECDDYANEYIPCSHHSSMHDGYVIKSPGLPAQVLAGVAPEKHIINDIELFMRMCFKPVILVTGTNGKSTVVALVEHILTQCGLYAVACGNNGVPIFDAYAKEPDMYVIELSSYQLENMVTTNSLASVVLNIGIDHVDRYSDMQEYQSIKEKIYRNSRSAVFPINQAGELTYALDIVGYKAIISDSTVSYVAGEEGVYGNGSIYCFYDELPIIGRHNALNVCSALCLCHAAGVSGDVVRHAISTFKGLEHRMEMVTTDKDGRLWINDSKGTNVHATRAALSSLSKNIVLIMGGQGKGEDYSKLFDEFSESIQCLITFGRDAELIASQAKPISGKMVVTDVHQAVSHANMVATKSSSILFSPACASFDQYVDYRHRGEDFKHCVLGEVDSNAR